MLQFISFNLLQLTVPFLPRSRSRSGDKRRSRKSRDKSADETPSKRARLTKAEPKEDKASDKENMQEEEEKTPKKKAKHSPITFDSPAKEAQVTEVKKAEVAEDTKPEIDYSSFKSARKGVNHFTC